MFKYKKVLKKLECTIDLILNRLSSNQAKEDKRYEEIMKRLKTIEDKLNKPMYQLTMSDIDMPYDEKLLIDNKIIYSSKNDAEFLDEYAQLYFDQEKHD